MQTEEEKGGGRGRIKRWCKASRLMREDNAATIPPNDGCGIPSCPSVSKTRNS